MLAQVLAEYSPKTPVPSAMPIASRDSKHPALSHVCGALLIVGEAAKCLIKSDHITSITPPGRLGNLYLDAYPAAEGKITLHFCNPSSSEAITPSGAYSFLAVGQAFGTASCRRSDRCPLTSS
jgi:hypothetical protein